MTWRTHLAGNGLNYKPCSDNDGGVRPNAAFVDVDGDEAGECRGHERGDRTATVYYGGERVNSAVSHEPDTRVITVQVRSRSAEVAATSPTVACRSSIAALPDSTTSLRPTVPDLASLSSVGTNDED